MNVALAPEYSARVRRAEPLSRHTSWHVGGPAEVFFNPRDVADLSAFLRSLPATFIAGVSAPLSIVVPPV